MAEGDQVAVYLIFKVKCLQVKGIFRFLLTPYTIKLNTKLIRVPHIQSLPFLLLPLLMLKSAAIQLLNIKHSPLKNIDESSINPFHNIFCFTDFKNACNLNQINKKASPFSSEWQGIKTVMKFHET